MIQSLCAPSSRRPTSAWGSKRGPGHHYYLNNAKPNDYLDNGGASIIYIMEVETDVHIEIQGTSCWRKSYELAPTYTVLPRQGS